MNKKLLALLFAVPGFGLAQTTYGVLGFAKQIGEVAVASENDGTHDFSIALGRDQGWYAHAKENNVGISRKNETKFRLVKTDKENVFKLYCVNNQKFVAYKDDREGENKTKFVVSKTEANTDWHVVPNMGKGGRGNKFDILPGSVDANNQNSQSWNVYGGVNGGNGVIGHYSAQDDGSAWCFEIVTQQLKFFSSYSKANDSYFMTIRDKYVHKDGEQFSADDKLQFGQEEYLFQLVGQPDNFKIYNVKSGTPIGTNPAEKDDNNRYRTTFESNFSVKSFGGRVYVIENRSSNLYLNFRDGFLSTWNNAVAWNGRNSGSQILFTTEDGILAEAAKKLEDEVKTQYSEDKFGDGLGLYPKQAYEGINGENGVLELLKSAQDPSAKIQDKKEAFQYAKYFLEMLSLNRPKNGDLLYIAATRDKNVKYFTSTLHADADKGFETYGSLGGHLTTKAQKGSDAVFYYKEEGGKVTLVSVSTGGQVAWAQRDALNYPTVLQSAEKGAEFKLTARGGAYAFESENRFLASDANLDYVLAYSQFSPFAGLRLERVAETLPVHIGDGGTASFWSPVEYSVPEGVTAYSVKIVNNKARLTKITTNVPKNTAVFLFGTPSSDVNLTVVPKGQTPALQDNILKGGAMPTTLEGTAFMLKKNGTGLVKVNGAVPAFKAYFTASESQVRELLDRGLTGVVSVATEAEDAPIYDLSGRRVQHTTKGGVYVTNGKKFIAK
jgi:hypothetical protein